jgi:RNA recognition motif-containing protein
MVDSHGRSKGYGFVSFKTVESVHKAVSSIHNKSLFIVYDGIFLSSEYLLLLNNSIELL